MILIPIPSLYLRYPYPTVHCMALHVHHITLNYITCVHSYMAAYRNGMASIPSTNIARHRIAMYTLPCIALHSSLCCYIALYWISWNSTAYITYTTYIAYLCIRLHLFHRLSAWHQFRQRWYLAVQSSNEAVPISRKNGTSDNRDVNNSHDGLGMVLGLGFLPGKVRCFTTQTLDSKQSPPLLKALAFTIRLVIGIGYNLTIVNHC